MGFLKDMEKMLNANHKVLLVGLLLVTLAIGLYTNRKGKSQEPMSVKRQPARPIRRASPLPRKRTREGMNNMGATGSGAAASQSSSGGSTGASGAATANKPEDLLPQSGGNNQFTQVDNKGVLGNVNLLKAGHHSGINTVGNSLRNANLQLRSDPPINRVDSGPWMQSTISPDVNRKQLEIGMLCAQ